MQIVRDKNKIVCGSSVGDWKHFTVNPRAFVILELVQELMDKLQI